MELAEAVALSWAISAGDQALAVVVPPVQCPFGQPAFASDALAVPPPWQQRPPLLFEL